MTAVPEVSSEGELSSEPSCGRPWGAPGRPLYGAPCRVSLRLVWGQRNRLPSAPCPPSPAPWLVSPSACVGSGSTPRREEPWRCHVSGPGHSDLRSHERLSTSAGDGLVAVTNHSTYFLFLPLSAPSSLTSSLTPAGSREGWAKDVGAITWVLDTLQGEAVPEDTKGSWGALGIWGDEWTPETGVA